MRLLFFATVCTLLLSPAASAEPATALDTWIWSPDPMGGGDLDRVLQNLAAMGTQANHLQHLDIVLFQGTGHQAHALAAAFGGDVERNQKLDLHLDRSVSYIEADAVKERIVSARDGATVLVVDTGIDSAHPDFQETLVANVRPELMGGLVVGSLTQGPVIDPAGHGTHIGGIVAGTGQALGGADATTGKYQGVYSVGRVASYQVTLDPPGSDEAQVDTSAALQAFDWALEHRREFDIQVVTNSWGASGDFEPTNAVNDATLRMYLAGLTVVFSGGNEGSDGADTLNKYCMAPWVLCVAAGDLQGARTPFSSIGALNAPYKHPDLTAPGLQIMSAHPLTSTRGLDLAGGLGQNLYSQRSGTSMAAPHVAAVAGLLLAANPDLSPDQVMDILVGTTDPMADRQERVGTGYLNAREAYNLAAQTVGNRPQFEAGEEVKYAGARSGDDGFANDPVSIGFDATVVPAPLLAPEEEAVWVLTSPVAWILVAGALIAVALGLQWRSPKPRTRPVTATRPGPGATVRQTIVAPQEGKT